MVFKMALVAGALFWQCAPAFCGVVADPGAYRTENYRAPVPDSLAGATTLDTAAAYALFVAGSTVFVDALPLVPKPSLPSGTVYREKPRYDIPRSIWLPDTGYGVLNDSMERWFAGQLDRVTGHNLASHCCFTAFRNAG